MGNGDPVNMKFLEMFSEQFKTICEELKIRGERDDKLAGAIRELTTEMTSLKKELKNGTFKSIRRNLIAVWVVNIGLIVPLILSLIHLMRNE
jgi:hypothetical protein